MDQTPSFEVEELQAPDVVPALHCGPTHCHLGFSIGDDEDGFEVEELQAPDVVPALHCGPTHCHLGFSIGDDETEED